MITAEAPKTGSGPAQEIAAEGSATTDRLRGKSGTSNRPKPQTPSLLRAGAWTLLGYCVFWVLMQSQTLWARPIAMPGSDAGPFERIRRLFPREWLQAPATSWLGFANALLYIALLLFLFGVYWRVLRSAFRPLALRAIADNRLIWFVLGVTGMSLLVLLFVPGTMSTDLHSYIWYGRIFHDFEANPFIYAPGDFAARDAGRWLDLVYWKEVPSVYGPVWVWLAGGIAWSAGLFGGDISSHLLGHRLLAAAAHMINVFLMWHVAGQVIARYWRKPSFTSALGDEDWRQGSRLGATLFYAWNPLLLIEFRSEWAQRCAAINIHVGRAVAVSAWTLAPGCSRVRAGLHGEGGGIALVAGIPLAAILGNRGSGRYTGYVEAAGSVRIRARRLRGGHSIRDMGTLLSSVLERRSNTATPN